MNVERLPINDLGRIRLLAWNIGLAGSGRKKYKIIGEIEMFKRKSNKSNEAGFTLVEIAIVLVIIGLLVGGILKGQSMIHNARVKRVVKQGEELKAAVYSFYDKYGMLPGDENLSNAGQGLPPGDSHNGDGSGQISAAEADMLFEDLVLGGFISGNFDGSGEDSIPRHAFGDTYRVLWVDPGNGAAHNVRFDNLPWDVCLEIDIKYDDGAYDSGSIRGSEDYVQATSPVGNFFMPL